MIIKERSELNNENIAALALETGFTYAAPLSMDALVFRSEVRDMCAEDRCGSYGRSWSCPPAAGSIERVKRQAEGFSRGIIVQTAGETGGSFDTDTVKALMIRHTKCFDAFVRQIRVFFPRCLPMGAGACRLCRVCTYPDRPCRHPDRMYRSMEAYGLLVSDVALRSGLRYNYGENTMSFTSCVLID